MLYMKRGKTMPQVSFTELRRNLARYMDEAVDNCAPILVTRHGGKGNVALLSEAEFESWQETVYLMRNPANARRLVDSIRSADAGRTEEPEPTPGPSPAET